MIQYHTLCAAGVLFAGRTDGLVEAWDLLECSHKPVLVSAASTVAVTSLCFSSDAPVAATAKRTPTQQLLAIGQRPDLLVNVSLLLHWNLTTACCSF